MENGPQNSLATFGSIAGKASPENNCNISFQENLSVKVFLHCRESRHPYQAFCRLDTSSSNRNQKVLCHIYEDIAFCVDVRKKKFVVTSQDFEHPEINGVLRVVEHFLGPYQRPSLTVR